MEMSSLGYRADSEKPLLSGESDGTQRNGMKQDKVMG